MRYLVTWKEKCTVLFRNSGIVEANSEQEARELIKDGLGDIEDSYEIDCYDGTILEIEDIQEDYDE